MNQCYTVKEIEGRPTDPVFEKFVLGAKKRMLSNDDDALIMCVGTTGTGKTVLGLHAYDIYSDSPSITQVALTRQDLAIAMRNAKQAKKDRFTNYDEAHVTKRSSMAQWNKDLIELYSSIRGLKILHWWNNPSLEMIDKAFIEERIKAVFFIYTKSKTKPRKYYFYTKDGLLRLLDYAGNLKHRTLKKYGQKFAYYQGWFRDYNGVLKDAYKLKKESRMEEHVEDFYMKYGLGDLQTRREFAQKTGYDEETVKRGLEWGVTSLHLQEYEHWVKKGSRTMLTKKGSDELENILHNRWHISTRAVKSPNSALNIVYARSNDTSATAGKRSSIPLPSNNRDKVQTDSTEEIE